MSKKLLEFKGINIPKTKLGQTKMEKLLASSEELFAKNGFYATSISDICKHAGTAVGTFYIYFETKTDVYKYLMETYKREIKDRLAENIKDCKTRYDKEREGIKCFIKYAVSEPNVYNIIWGSLSIDRQLFVDYYTSFASSYSRALREDDDVFLSDTDSIAYMLMGISNFLGLKAMFTSMTDEQVDEMVDTTVMPALKCGILK
ncbi:MAG: TetR/AcrR family transcriptional regulator [Clostridia bacterium]|nr:TetR/AcrR family transcriptional regulator [Clostridia bacterium]